MERSSITLYLVVGGEFHGCHGVQVLLALGEQVVPSTDDAALVLIVDHLQLVGLPRLPDLQKLVVRSSMRSQG